MPRRRVVARREVLPDPKFGNLTIAKFMNHLMVSGKKSLAERIVYGALELVDNGRKKERVEGFARARENFSPWFGLRSRGGGGAPIRSRGGGGPSGGRAL